MSKHFQKTNMVVALYLALLIMTGSSQSVLAGKLDPCTLLTPAEIQEVVGKPVAEGHLNEHASATVGKPCEFKVGDSGSFSLWIGENTTNTHDKVYEALQKQGAKLSDAPGIGDQSFYMEPGYGMLQLNTWKGSTYFIITLMVPGATVEQEMPMASALMKKILEKL